MVMKSVAPEDEPVLPQRPERTKLSMRMIQYWDRMIHLWWFIGMEGDTTLAYTIDILLHQAYRRWYGDIIPWSGQTEP